MPRKPMKPCCHPGCPKLTEGRYCEEHEALHRGERKSAAGRGYNSKWQRARKRFLKEHPLCCKCEEEGKYVRATIVDHIKPHRGDPKMCIRDRMEFSQPALLSDEEIAEVLSKADALKKWAEEIYTYAQNEACLLYTSYFIF